MAGEVKTPLVCTSVKEVGLSSDRNARFRRFMEDTHTIADKLCDDEGQGFFGVYDGHGGKGAAQYCKQYLHKIFEDHVKDIKGDIDQEQMTEIFTKVYAKTDEEMKPSVPSAGACVVTAYVRKGDKRMLHVANAGDSRAVLSRNGQAVRLSVEHSCNEEEEKRIVEAGGFVTNGRVNGMVAVARSLGDHCMKDFIISKPHVVSLELQETDSFLILACDGLWDVTEDQQAIDLIKDETDIQEMSKKLLIHALRGGSTDNVSVMVIRL
eukprot:TRINITY_DN2999_c0_g1_i1.p1 TRINITY_DN2999_c0_g1~~TRINITY_DN2999_c0_g1_i1.p1  ORF type:complete len:279 (-),score=74.19 TRINITY_DN2999_c0_g1_i1:151-948(-)